MNNSISKRLLAMIFIFFVQYMFMEKILKRENISKTNVTKRFQTDYFVI